jgi:hypothetical protein
MCCVEGKKMKKTTNLLYISALFRVTARFGSANSSEILFKSRKSERLLIRYQASNK